MSSLVTGVDVCAIRFLFWTYVKSYRTMLYLLGQLKLHAEKICVFSSCMNYF